MFSKVLLLGPKHGMTAWTNFSILDEPWAEFSTSEVAACIPWTYCPVQQYNLTQSLKLGPNHFQVPSRQLLHSPMTTKIVAWDQGDQIGRNFAIWAHFKRPGQISGDKYGLLLGILRVWKDLIQMFCTVRFSFEDVLAFFWLCNCFGYFIQNLG